MLNAALPGIRGFDDANRIRNMSGERDTELPGFTCDPVIRRSRYPGIRLDEICTRRSVLFFRERINRPNSILLGDHVFDEAGLVHRTIDAHARDAAVTSRANRSTGR